MNVPLRIAAGELLLLARSRVALIGVLALLLLSAIAAFTSGAQMQAERDYRASLQVETDALFDAQPARHPHRMVHYGTYVYRPISPLAAFDPGIDPYTGTTLYLEGHRQNSAMFGAVRENSSLMRFGQLTPAFVLQTLAPLLLAFLGFSMVTRERETATLRQLRLHGASGASIILGKTIALGSVALLALAPALIALIWISLAYPLEASAALLLGFGYALYLVVWSLMIVGVSAFVATSRTSLVTLVAAWVFIAVIAPRGASEWAARAAPLPTRAETDLRLGAELRSLGDSHNADDPFFAAFRARTLAQYGVSRVEDLPFNYRGALSAEGEALTSRLFDAYFERSAATQRKQAQIVANFGVFSPTISVRRMSMVAAGTDLETHLRFLEQAEAYRFDLIQRLNTYHRDLLAFADDAKRSRDPEAERRTRIAAENWARLPDFRFTPASAHARHAELSAAFLALGGWLAFALVLCGLGARRLEGEQP